MVELTDALLKIAVACPGLQMLAINSCPQLMQEHIIALVRQWRHLKTLQVRNCDFDMTSPGVFELLKDRPLLHVITDT